MKIKFYGGLGDRLGREIDVSLADETRTVAGLRTLLARLHPGAARDLQGRSRACIGETIVGDDQRLADDDVVEFFPPLSGG